MSQRIGILLALVGLCVGTSGCHLAGGPLGPAGEVYASVTLRFQS